jgi:hypothetical protein
MNQDCNGEDLVSAGAAAIHLDFSWIAVILRQGY